MVLFAQPLGCQLLDAPLVVLGVGRLSEVVLVASGLAANLGGDQMDKVDDDVRLSVLLEPILWARSLAAMAEMRGL